MATRDRWIESRGSNHEEGAERRRWRRERIEAEWCARERGARPSSRATRGRPCIYVCEARNEEEEEKELRTRVPIMLVSSLQRANLVDTLSEEDTTGEGGYGEGEGEGW